MFSKLLILLQGVLRNASEIEVDLLVSEFVLNLNPFFFHFKHLNNVAATTLKHLKDRFKHGDVPSSRRIPQTADLWEYLASFSALAPGRFVALKPLTARLRPKLSKHLSVKAALPATRRKIHIFTRLAVIVQLYVFPNVGFWVKSYQWW